jgi:Outer membrane protein beta-barrel domain
MHRSLLLALILFAWMLVTGAQSIRAQEGEPRWEAGGHFTAVSFNNDSPLTNSPGTPFESSAYPTAYGFGGRVGYNVHRNVAVEAEFNYFPRDRFGEGGRKFQGLFGVKAGKRFERVGVYAKLRPGFVNFSRGDFTPRPNVLCIPLNIEPCLEPESTTNFALDAGGVLELHTSKKSFVRLDAGDTIISFGRRLAPLRTNNSNFGFVVQAEGETTHNFQGSVGFGFRF